MSWTDRLDNLRASLPNFEERAEQTRLAQTIEKAFANGTHLEAQAGTGTGKSYAALIPAIEHAQATGRPVVIATETKALQAQYCLAPETKVLTADLRYIPIGDVAKGMELAGFEEERVGARRHFRKAVVESAELIERPCYRLTFDDGTEVVSSSEHKWLVAKTMEVKWMTTEQLCVTAGKRPGSKVIRLFDTWETDRSYEAGYVAAAFDGEGHLRQATTEVGQANVLAFAQRDNAMLALVEKSLAHLGLGYRRANHPDIVSVAISGRRDIVRLLGQCRPARLLEKFDFGKLGTINIRQAGASSGQRVIKKEFLGLRPVMAVQTSTHTLIAEGLASHNCNKDVPFLKEHLGIDFSAALLKGRSNYLCRQRLTEATEKEVLNIAQLREEVESAPEMTGDMEDLITDVGLDERRALTMSSEECPGKRECPFGDVCFAERAKERARSADVIIANHHLLATEVSLREETHSDEFPDGIGFLPEFSGLVIDEAHGFQDVATDLLGGKFAERQLLRFATDAATLLEDNKIPAPLERAAHTLFLTLTEWMDEQNKRNRTRDRSMELPHTVIERFFESFIAVTDEIAEVKRAVKRLDTYGNDRDEQRKKRMVKRADNLIKRMAGFVSASSDELVRWVELASTPRGDTLELHYAPLDVAPYLDEWLWSRHTTVLMSATLAVGNDFSFITQQLGLPSPTTFDAGTPFDYPNQAAFFCPQIECDPTSGAKWQARVAVAIDKLVGAADGRALILFTSRRELEAAWTSTHELIEDRGISVFKQVAGGNNRALGEEFKSNERSVLFALKSFMTGFDVQGSSLELVILNKLPFANPSDIILKARCDALDRQVEAQRKNKWVHGSFPKITVPTMTLVLLQAFGRLIRTRNDRGVVVLLDDRLYTKGYGSRIRKALPPAETLTRLVEAEDYLRDLRSVVG